MKEKFVLNNQMSLFNVLFHEKKKFVPNSNAFLIKYYSFVRNL
jgi:hypothetical protein